MVLFILNYTNLNIFFHNEILTYLNTNCNFKSHLEYSQNHGNCHLFQNLNTVMIYSFNDGNYHSFNIYCFTHWFVSVDRFPNGRIGDKCLR